MGRLIMQAKVQGMNEYNASEGAQLALESEKSLIEGIRNDSALNDEYWQTGYDLGNEFTKGLSAARANNTEPFRPGGTWTWSSEDWGGSSYAYGLKTVPYDNFPALLHEGEKVLTAAEVRSGSGAGNITVTVTGNSFSVRSDDDADMIAAMIVTRIEEAMLSYGG